MVAAAIIGTGVLAAGTSLYGSSQAAGSADKAANLANERYGTTRGDLMPYNTTGYNALSGAYNLAGLGPNAGGPDYISQAAGALPGTMTQAELESTPGYQFDLSQGLKAVQSSAAARGLGVSGASMKGAGAFATGLANKTYLDQFNVRQKRFEDFLNLNTGQQGNTTNAFNRLNSIATLGANAAAGLGTTGTALANQAGNYINQAGLADAAGVRGVGSAVTGAANNYLMYDAYKQGLNPGTGGYDAVGNPYSKPNTLQAWQAQQGVY